MNSHAASCIRYTAVLVCLLPNACSLPRGTAESKDTLKTANARANDDRESEEPLDQKLVTLLRDSEQIVKPFAWGPVGGAEERYQIVGIDQQAKLKSVILTKRAGSYLVLSAGAHALREDVLMQTSDSLNLKTLLSDREFPFKSDILNMQNCKVHFVFVWRARNRSLTRKSILTGIDLRVIVERESQILSNEAQGFLFFGMKEASVMDLNGDGKQDYVFIGEDNSKHVYVWTALSEGKLASKRGQA